MDRIIFFFELFISACECNQVGSISNDCDLITGQCKCLSSFGGERCERCKHGYYNYPKCQCKYETLEKFKFYFNKIKLDRWCHF